MEYIERYERWLKDNYISKEDKELLMKMSEDEIKESFFKELEFGTGGLRGILGLGSNRVNFYTIGKATQGLANFIKKKGVVDNGVVIAYDSRSKSDEFAQRAGEILAANGIKAYVFSELTPVPILSFSVRHLKAAAGIVITASHNPPEYNGYKVYWEDGAQVSPPWDGEIIDEVAKISDYGQILRIDKDRAIALGLYINIGDEIFRAYDKALLDTLLQKDLIQNKGYDLNIVYTPLHGSGNKPLRRNLENIGFSNVFVVKEQELPDPLFSTLDYPNPEDPKVFKLALDLAREKNADLILATDPDADRIGVMVKEIGGYSILSGNMIGTLLTDYILKIRSEKKELPSNGAIIKTIVSTESVMAIADSYNVKTFNVLTGFKYIGLKIKEFEETHDYTYLFGFEESYGALAGTYARDKDAVAIAVLICEMTLYYKQRGLTLLEALADIYKKYGYFLETSKSITMKGIDGMEKMGNIMSDLRNDPPIDFNDIKVVEIKDYKLGIFKNCINGKECKSPYQISDVLYYRLEDETWICIRPSGTEAKLKYYVGVKGSDEEKSIIKAEKICKEIEERIGV